METLWLLLDAVGGGKNKLSVKYFGVFLVYFGQWLYVREGWMGRIRCVLVEDYKSVYGMLRYTQGHTCACLEGVIGYDSRKGRVKQTKSYFRAIATRSNFGMSEMHI